MITAEQARKLSGPRARDYLEFLEAEIEAAAKNQKTSVTIREDPYSRWLYSEKDCSPQALAAINVLRRNGFELTLLYKESQFVDMGLTISW